MTLDKVLKELHASMLKDARRETPLVRLAAVLLVRSDGSRGVVHETCEYGDGEGIDAAREVMDDIQCPQAGLLQQGESLELVLLETTLDAMQSKPLPPPLPPQLWSCGSPEGYAYRVVRLTEMRTLPEVADTVISGYAIARYLDGKLDRGQPGEAVGGQEFCSYAAAEDYRKQLDLLAKTE